MPCLGTTGTALSTVAVIGSVVNRQLKKHCAERNSQLSYGSVIVTVTASNIVGLYFCEDFIRVKFYISLTVHFFNSLFKTPTKCS